MRELQDSLDAGTEWMLSGLSAVLQAVEVMHYSAWVAQEAGLDQQDRQLLRLAAFLHDVGKVCVPFGNPWAWSRPSGRSRPGRLLLEVRNSLPKLYAETYPPQRIIRAPGAIPPAGSERDITPQGGLRPDAQGQPQRGQKALFFPFGPKAPQGRLPPPGPAFPPGGKGGERRRPRAKGIKAVTVESQQLAQGHHLLQRPGPKRRLLQEHVAQRARRQRQRLFGRLDPQPPGEQQILHDVAELVHVEV
ncbi:MAG: HD domain-containing protein [Clostridia bacterium]|nr:HD domain-containing protein [Clostridia bacterium]